MKRTKIIGYIGAVLLALSVLNINAQRQPANTTPVVKSTNDASNVNGNGTLLKSGIKTLGTIGRNDRYEVVQFKVRGVDTPNLAGVLVYDSKTDEIVGLQSASGPGIGAAAVNGGAAVGASYLFGSKLRPDTTSVSNGSNSSATGGNASSEANSTGGNANATGGNGNGGAGGAGGGGFVPPGHQNPKPGKGPK